MWQRWQALGGKPRAAEPDALSLAAYAEGRLTEAEAEAVEAWLAAAPEGLDDIVAARAFDQRPPRLVYEHILSNACDLVPGAAPANIANLMLRRQPPRWRNALAWSSIAASLVCASMVGFSMGSDAYANLAGTQTADSASEVLGTPPSLDTLDNYFSDDSGT
ncbi:MAG TPA: hypothetical protein VGL83_09345 [Stellaceae bacterium]